MASGEARLSRLQRLTYRVWLAVGVVVLTAVSVWLLYRPFAVILAPTLLAFLIVYLLNPVVTWFERQRVHRLLGTTIAYVAVAGVLAGLTALVLPLLSAQIQELGEAAPEIGNELLEAAQRGATALGLNVDIAEALEVNAVAAQVEGFVTDAANRETVIAILVGLSGVARGALFFLFTITVGPVIAFYILVDLPRFKEHARRLAPPAYRKEMAEVAAKLGAVVGGFVRGQLLIALVIGVAASVVLGVVGLRYWLVVGIIAGITNLIPLLGPFVAGLIGASIAFVTEGVGFAILVVLAMTAVQQLDGHLMTPLIMGRTVRVHPLAVLLVVLIAGVLYGVFGMLVAVPLVAGAKVLAQHVWQTRVPWAEPPDRSPPGGDATEVVDGTANGESDVPLADTGLTRELPEWESVER
jgi:predicted PurR-regulated permease PerM